MVLRDYLRTGYKAEPTCLTILDNAGNISVIHSQHRHPNDIPLRALALEIIDLTDEGYSPQGIRFLTAKLGGYFYETL